MADFELSRCLYLAGALPFLVLGTAHAPENKSVSSLDVGVSVGALQKTLRVFGDRVWQAGATGSLVQ